MIKAPIPKNEASRLASVRALKLLDTPAEERFDRIARLAKAFFNTQFVLINLVDGNRLWMKAKIGIDVNESPRETSFCGHTILGSELFIIEDAIKDPRFFDNPFVLGDRKVRFYAGAPLAAPDGERVGTLCVFDDKVRNFTENERVILRDLADLVQHELGLMDLKVAIDKLNQAKRFFDVSQDHLSTLDFTGTFTFLSPNWPELLGFEYEEILGHKFMDFVVPEDLEKSNAEFAKVALGQTAFNFENRYRTKSGGVVWLLWNATAFPHEKIVFCSARDITEKKKIEELKEEFVANVTHELRTPITSIRGSLGVLEAGLAGKLPEEAMRLINIGSHNCERLVRLVDDILDIDKLESGKMEFHMTTANLREVVKNAVICNEGYGNQYGVKIHLLPGLESLNMRMDTDRITQVVTNLISNAVKFSPKGDSIEISVVRRGKTARVSVQDHGSGIPESFKSQIFGKFAQSAEGKSKKSSSGLGLNICKAIIESHGGNIGYDSSTGKGTTFYFDLPELISQ